MIAVDPFAIQQAEIRASALVAAYGFGREDWEDLRQDLLLDYLQRLPRFDARRGDARGFTYGVVRHRATQLAAAHRRRTRVLMNQGSSRERTVVNHDLRLDVGAVVARLPEHLRVIAELLPDRTQREVARVTGRSRSRVHQLVRQIRGAFIEAGVTPEALSPRGAR